MGACARSRPKLEAEIEQLLERARRTDQQEDAQPQLDIPAELQRREQRLEMIRAARERLEARQAEEDAARGRKPDDERQPRHPDGTPKRGKRYKREFVASPMTSSRTTSPIRTAAS